MVVSAATGLLVTRVSPEKRIQDLPLHEQIQAQVFGNYRTLTFLSLALIFFSLIPGLGIPFSLMAIMTGIFAYIQFSNEQLKFEEALQEEQEKDEIIDDPQTDMQLGALLSVQPLALGLGMDLVPLVDDRTSEKNLEH